MNPILENIIKERNGHYVHVLEVSTPCELESCIDALVNEFINEYDKEDIRLFILSLEIYYHSDFENWEDQEAVYNYNINEHLSYLLD